MTTMKNHWQLCRNHQLFGFRGIDGGEQSVSAELCTFLPETQSLLCENEGSKLPHGMLSRLCAVFQVYLNCSF